MENLGSVIPAIVTSRWVKRKSDQTISRELNTPIDILRNISKLPEYIMEVEKQVLSDGQRIRSFITTYKRDIHVQIDALSKRMAITTEQARDVLRLYYGTYRNIRNVINIVAEEVFGESPTYEELERTKQVVKTISGSDTYIARQAVVLLQKSILPY